MISKSKVLAIRHLLEEGKLSRRKIARQLGVSRKTVRRVESKFLRKSSEEPPFRFPRGPHRRCHSCGARVQLPCLVCQVRDWKNKKDGVE